MDKHLPCAEDYEAVSAIVFVSEVLNTVLDFAYVSNHIRKSSQKLIEHCT